MSGIFFLQAANAYDDDRFSNFSEAEEAQIEEENVVSESSGDEDDDEGEDLFGHGLMRYVLSNCKRKKQFVQSSSLVQLACL